MNNYVIAISIGLYLMTFIGLYNWIPCLLFCLYIYFVDFAEKSKRTELEGEKNELKSEINQLKEEIDGLGHEYELKRKELEDEIEPLKSLLELKEDKIVELINNDKVFLSKRISKKSTKKFFEQFGYWVNSYYGIPTGKFIEGKEVKIRWDNVEKALFDAIDLDKKYQLKFKKKEIELEVLKAMLQSKQIPEVMEENKW